ncbi:Calcium/calmodulin-dependent protein kinase [Handroanthus impetiginosus]|uniref:Calcium/calmodulin-dependent protein kinase n=1 Tax=Handroanthus impetiginosus TaxID=429701 RepID=A0A2G9HU35_9LAMI|nr:Calcium/calmodulin-dependent protein kinase [Handroanthus impetiginosus]
MESCDSSPNYMRATTSFDAKKENSSATSCSEGKKMHSESVQPKLTSPSHRSLQTLSRTSSFRNVRFFMKKTSFKSRRLSYAKVSEDVSVDRATYSSTLKDAKFPEVEIHNEGIDSEKVSALKACRYYHCSLHGHCHGGHDDLVPPPKRFLYKRRRSMKKQRSLMPKTESKMKHSCDKNKSLQKSQMVPIVEGLDQEGLSDNKGVDSNEEIYAEVEARQFGDGYDGIQELDLTEVAFGETSFPERCYEENLNILKKYSSQGQGYCLRCSCHKTEQAMFAPGRAEVDLSPLKVDSLTLDDGYNNEIHQNGNTDLETSTPAHFENPEECVSTKVKDSGTLISADEASNKDCPETPVVFEEVTKKNSVLSSASYNQTSSNYNSEEEGEIATESPPAGDLEVNKVMQVKESEANSHASVQFSQKRHISMWHLIHQHMSSNLAEESENKPLQVADGDIPVDGADPSFARESSASIRDLLDSEIGTGNNDSENQEIEVRKLLAIKLVREAIEKILLPEVQDQTFDDQSVTSENAPQAELIEKNQSEACTQENHAESKANKEEGNVPSCPKEEIVIAYDASGPEIKETEEKVVRKSEKKAPKHWSNLKKWILLQRFIRELDKVKKFNPRKPQLLPLNPDPEAEKRRNAEEWMLDYALRQAVNQLAPNKKKKVALLVKAFETVVPLQEEPQVQFRIPRIKDNSIDIGSKREEASVNGKAVPACDDGVSILESENQDTGTDSMKNTEKLLVLNDNSCESSASKEENAREHSGDHVDLQDSHKDSNVSLKSEYSDGGFIPSNGNMKPEDCDVENGKPSSTTQSLIFGGNGKSVATDNTLVLSSCPEETEREARWPLQGLQEDAISDCTNGNTNNSGEGIQMDRKNHIKMWHMIYQHVVSGIAEKVGRHLLDGSGHDEGEDNETPAINNGDYSDNSLHSSQNNHVSCGFTKSDAVKLIKEAVDEILVREIQDDSSDAQSITSESVSDQDIAERNVLDEDAKAESQASKKSELPKAKNWSKLKKLMLLRRSIRALEKARELKPQSRTLLPQMSNPEPEKVELRSQMMDERKKAEQWMLDYAVQHIVTKLTPTRKRMVSMLVEAFEAVVPLPEM